MLSKEQRDSLMAICIAALALAPAVGIVTFASASPAFAHEGHGSDKHDDDEGSDNKDEVSEDDQGGGDQGSETGQNEGDGDSAESGQDDGASGEGGSHGGSEAGISTSEAAATSDTKDSNALSTTSDKENPNSVRYDDERGEPGNYSDRSRSSSSTSNTTVPDFMKPLPASSFSESDLAPERSRRPRTRSG